VRRYLVVGIGVLIVAAVIGITTFRGNGSDLQAGISRVDRPLPRLEGTTVLGGTADSHDLLGRVTLVNVWATWCDPCRREQPALERLYRAYHDRGVAFLGINYRDDDAAARAWVREFDVSYPSIVDRPGAFADDLGFPALPDTFLVDRDGTIRYVAFGETNEQELRPLLDELLAS
jgi:cytochrome c biogenesis protein CcmG/thiol:disulfide interchange protein DsbE